MWPRSSEYASSNAERQREQRGKASHAHQGKVYTEMRRRAVVPLATMAMAATLMTVAS